MKSRTALKLKHLHSALKPHIQRLKLERGTERDKLEQIIANVCSKMKKYSGLRDTEDLNLGDESGMIPIAINNVSYQSAYDQELTTDAVEAENGEGE